MSQPSGPYPAIALTRGPKHHFFGYYGICPWNASGTLMVCLETDFHEHPPTADDVARVGVVELASGQFHALAETHAFNLQQGAMLHWLPSDPENSITFNARQGDRFVAVVLDVQTGKRRVLPRPIAGISPDGHAAASLNYARLKSLRPVVGYAGLPDLFANQHHPTQDGLYIMDLESGDASLAISYQRVYEFMGRNPEMDLHNIWFNHIIFNTNGTRYCFVNRWNEPGIEIKHTTLLSADVDGSNLRCITDYNASHFAWRSPTELIGWVTMKEGPHYYRINDATGEYEVMNAESLPHNGHMSFTRDGRWMLSDTGPDKQNLRSVFLWDMVEERQIILGKFLSPPPFRGEIRCDPHPRWSRDEKMVSFDSIHDGTRQVYAIDVSSIVG